MKDAKSLKVLFIDDDLNAREYFKAILSQIDCDVALAVDGREGLAMLEDNQFDLVITDLVMPKISGLDVLRSLKESSPEIPVIMISGMGTIENVVESLRMGAWDYIIKPTKPEIVLQSVNRVIRRKEIIDENEQRRKDLIKVLEIKNKDLQKSKENLAKEITGKKQIESALEESKELYNQLFDNIGTGVAIYGPVNDGENFVFVDINKAGQILSDIDKHQLIGRPITECFPGVKNLGLFEVFQKVWKTGEPEHHPLSLYKDRRISQWVENYVFRLPSGFLVAVYEDTTIEKQAEEKIMESEKKFTQLAEVIPDVFWLASIADEEQVEYVSPAFQRIFGHPVEDLYENPRLWMECIHSDDAVVIRNTFEKFIQDKGDYDVMYRIVQKHGTIRWIHDRGFHFRDAKGRLQKVGGLASDVTSLKEYHDDLNKSESFLNSIIDQSPNPMWISDSEGTLIRINKSCQALLNITEVEVVGKYNIFKDNIVEEHGFIPLTKSVYEDGVTVNFTIKYDSTQLKRLSLEKHASLILEVTIFPIKDIEGKVTNAVIHHRDITQRLQAERELKDNLDFLEILIDTIPNPVYFKNRKGVYQGCNKAFSKLILGRNKKDIIGKTLLDFSDAVNKKLIQEYHTRDMELFKKGGIQRYETDVLCVDGKKRHFFFNKACYQDSGGNISGMIGIMLDITNRKEAEVEILNYQEKLKKLAAYLQNIREEERKYIGREIHDELGQKLTAMKFDALYLRDRMKSDKSKNKHKIDTIIALIDDTIGTVQRISRELKPTILEDLGLKAAVESLASEIKARTSIDVELGIEPPDLQVEYNLSLAIYRLVQESLNNVSRHSQADNVSISIHRDEDRIRIAVEDNGVGITEDSINDINSMGIIGMRERILGVGGDFTIGGSTDKGTKIKAVIPLGGKVND